MSMGNGEISEQNAWTARRSIDYNLKAVTILAMTTLQAAFSLDGFVGAGLGGTYFKDEPLSLLRLSASKMSAKFDWL